MRVECYIVGQVLPCNSNISNRIIVVRLLTIGHEYLTARATITARRAVHVDNLPDGLVHSLALEYREQRATGQGKARHGGLDLSEIYTFINCEIKLLKIVPSAL